MELQRSGAASRGLQRRDRPQLSSTNENHSKHSASPARIKRMRKSRVLQVGAWYHVTAQTHRKELTLNPSRAKVLFLGVVSRAKKRFSFSIDNFSVMGSHVHFIVKPADNANLSRIMQWILSVFAMDYNRSHGVIGHFWAGRFFSRILGNLSDYLRTFEYIDENPVKAGLIDFRWNWRYGGLYHRRRGRGDIVGPLPFWLAVLLPAHSTRHIGKIEARR